MRASSLITAAGLAAAAACSGGGTSSSPGAAGPQVRIADYSFSPSTLTIKAGTTVTWTNSGPSTHTVTSDTMVWQSSNLVAPGPPSDPYGGGGMPGGSFQFTFNTPGTYAYHCSLHPPSMMAFTSFTGTIVVTQ